MTKPVVVVDPHFRTMTEIFDSEALGRLHDLAEVVWAKDEPMPGTELAAQVDRATAVVFGRWRADAPKIEEFGPQLRALLEVSGGHEHTALDYQAALARNLLIGSCAPAFGPEVAEHGLALALSCLRGIATADREMRAGTERWLHQGNATNTTLLGKTVGFIGCGSISVHLQRLLAPFEVQLLGYDPPMPTEAMVARGIKPTALHDLLQQATVVFVLAAPTASATHLIDRAALEQLDSGQALIVLSRGSLVDFEALTALAERRGFSVGIDVYPAEPIAADSPVRRLPNASLTPHLAGAMPSALQRIGTLLVDDLESIVAGENPERFGYLRPNNRARYLQAGDRADTR